MKSCDKEEKDLIINQNKEKRKRLSQEEEEEKDLIINKKEKRKRLSHTSIEEEEGKEIGAVLSVPCSSNRRLCFPICHDTPILVEDGKRSVSVDKWSGKLTSYIIGPRDLHLAAPPKSTDAAPPRDMDPDWRVRYTRPGRWVFVSKPESRFKEVVESRDLVRLEIGAKIRGSMLSIEDTKYAAYLVYQVGFHSHAKIVEARRAFKICTEALYLQSSIDASLWKWRIPKSRADGWREVELGYFGGEGDHYNNNYNNNGSDIIIDLQISVKDECPHNGQDLTVLGIEIRPVAEEEEEEEEEEIMMIKNNGNGNGGLKLFDQLPEECVAKILSCTTPADACRLSCVNSTFRSAAASGLVWDTFLPMCILPPDYRTISSAPCTSKRRLFFHVCDHSPLPIALDKGTTKTVSVDKWSGKMTYMIGPSDLHLPISSLGDPEPGYWQILFYSRLSSIKVAVSRQVRRLKIGGKIRRSMLLPDTKYAAYLVFKLLKMSSGFGYFPAEALVAIGGHQICTKSVYLDPNKEELLRHAGCELLWKWGFPKKRADGWLEVELGHFESHQYGGQDDDVELHISVKDIRLNYVKHGLTVRGIEIRHKN